MVSFSKQLIPESSTNINMTYTKEQVDKFLVEKLKFPEWKTMLETDKPKFLTEVMRRHLVHIYYQNLTMTAKDPKERDTPSLTEIIETGIVGGGGVCFEMNYFLMLLLASIGLDAYAVKSSFGGPGAIPDSHCMVVVRLSENEKYLIDIASIHPMEEAVPLHKLPYRGRAAGFWFEYRYNFNNDGLYTRYQIGGSFFNGPYSENQPKEQLRFFFTLDPIDHSAFVRPMRPIYTDSDFVKVPFFFRYTKFTDTEYEFVIIVSNNVAIAGRDTIKVEKHENIDGILPAIAKYFPDLNESTKQKAFSMFRAANHSHAPPI